MFLTIVGPVGHEETRAVVTRGMNLATLLGNYGQAVEACFINNNPTVNWGGYIPQRNDRVTVHINTGIVAAMIPAIVTTIISAEMAAMIANAVIMAVVNLVIGIVVQALTPQPKAAKLDGSPTPYGITGFQNTTGQGVPIPVYWGENIVTPHIVAGGIDVSADHKTMLGKVLYCIGDSMGDGYQSLSNVEIDNIPVSQYEGVRVDYRLGTMDQTVIPEFENTSTPWFDGRNLPWDDVTNDGDWIIYETKATNVSRIGVTFAFPGGLYRMNKTGSRRPEIVSIWIQYQRVGDDPNAWTYSRPKAGEYVGDRLSYHFEDDSQSALYYKIFVDFGSVCQAAADRYWLDYPDVKADPYFGTTADAAYDHYTTYKSYGYVWHFELCSGSQWRVRFMVNGSHMAFPKDENHSAQVQLYNVEEIIFTTRAYPGYVLLALLDIPAKQIKSLQSMKVTVKVEGKKIAVPGFTEKVYSRKRAWIVRDMMVGPCGMDYEFDESEINEAQWITESAYHDTVVDAQGGGTELYDLCDVPCTNRQWDWDWVKAVAGEGRARVIPSGYQWHLLIDKPGSPNLLYSEPGNVIENSIQMEIGPLEDDPYTEIIAEFRDVDDNDRPALTPPIYADPANPPPSIIQKAIHFDTIRRESQAIRECRVIIKRQFLERRRWNFSTPIGMIVSEPWDLDYFCERKIGETGAYTGVLPAGSTTTTVTLPFIATLEADRTYMMAVQRRDASPTERKIVSTGPGNWGQVEVTSPFSIAPAEGDWCALGRMEEDYTVTRCQDVKIDNSGKISQIRTVYKPEVYTADDLPPKSERRKFGYSSIPPLPLLDAAVSAQVVTKNDGTQGNLITFDITPGLISHTGQVRGAASTNYFQADSTFEPLDWWNAEYYRDAWVQMLNGQNWQQGARRIYHYDPGPMAVYFDPPFPYVVEYGAHYKIFWEKFTDTHGFILETSLDASAWTEIARPTGFHYQRDGDDLGGFRYYRFTPLNAYGVPNNFGRQIRWTTVVGDSVAPAAPISVVAFATTLFITVEATFTLPMAYDFSGIEILVRQFQYGGVPVRKIYAVIPVVNTRMDATRENGTSGTIAIKKTVDVRNIYTYPPVPQAWDVAVRAYDYSGNKSAWVQGNDFYPQKLTAADIQS